MNVLFELNNDLGAAQPIGWPSVIAHKGAFVHLGEIVLRAMVDNEGKRAGWSAKFPIKGRQKYINTDVFDNPYDAYITAVCIKEQGYVRKYNFR